MTPEQRMETAKHLYGEGDAAFNAGDFATALAKFEEAYNVYKPDLHVFNINIGLAAHELGDCVKAKTAFQRFLDLVPQHDSRALAQEKLLEIERSGCANAQPSPTTTPTTTTPTTTTPMPADDEDAPILTSRSTEREAAAEEERKQRDASKAGPLLITGAVLAGLGGACLIGGAVSLGMANSKANELVELASPSRATGFPSGNYADDEVFNTDRNTLPALNSAAIGLFVGGGVLAITGVALIVVDRKRKKSSKNARIETSPHLVNVGPTYLPGGGGAAATLRF